jgi:hypothetical protein
MLAPRFAERPGGYTRILKVGFRRGDGAEVAQVELIGSEWVAPAETPEGGESEAPKKTKGVGERLRQVARRRWRYSRAAALQMTTSLSALHSWLSEPSALETGSKHPTGARFSRPRDCAMEAFLFASSAKTIGRPRYQERIPSGPLGGLSTRPG